MEERGYTVGLVDSEWGKGVAQTITFIVTEDCNLRCKYCYVTHKSKNKVLSLDTAKKFIDYLLTCDEIERSDSIILDFIGGEPLLETELIDQICDYFKFRTFELGNEWYWKYRINISTNGVNYSSQEVQNFIKKNEGKVSIGITIDGTKEKHDMQRVFPDGSGSYDIVYENVKLWMTQFEATTKVTFASDDLIYLKDSIIHLWNIGIHDIAANVVYEDVWKENDDEIFEKQLKELADYIIDHDLYNTYHCTLFLEFVGLPYEKSDLCHTSCGAGKMLALGPDGNIYPCVRYYDHSLNHKAGYIIGNVEEGVDLEKSRTFLLTMYKYQCDEECLECPIARGCEFCQGFNYDEADSETNFQKAKYICKMHKARVRANNYYFAKLYHKKGIKREGYYWKKKLLFLLNEDYVSFCSYEQNGKKQKRMSREEVIQGLRYAEKHFMQPIFIHSKDMEKWELTDYENYEIVHRIPIEAYFEDLPFYDYQIVTDLNGISCLDKIPMQDNLFFNIRQDEIGNLSEAVDQLLNKAERINVNIQDITPDFNLKEYEKQLESCVEQLAQTYRETEVLKELNIITDLLFIEEHEGCDAGVNSYSYAPGGQFYVCPAFYSEGLESIGNVENGLDVKNPQLYTEDYMPLCQGCDAFQCENCKYINKKYTKEVNVSPSFQCMKAQIERRVSQQLQRKLPEYPWVNILEDKVCQDPINLLYPVERAIGYYKFKPPIYKSDK